jgi:hypothetical protein
MGDYFQVIVDKDATEAESLDLGDVVLKWLISEKIVSPSTCDCVLGTEVGYPPGSRYVTAVIEPCDSLIGLWTNGLDIITKRTVFHSGQGGFELVCSSCFNRFEQGDEWGAAVDEWLDDKGPGLLACPRCKCVQAITEWKHDPEWGFGNLGFEFWNWPPFTEKFLEDISKLLKHRVVLVAGKL